MKVYRRSALFLILAACLAQGTAYSATWQYVSDVARVERLHNGVELQAGSARIRVVAVNESVVRVRLAPDGMFPPDHSWAVLPSSESEMRVEINDSPQMVEFSTQRLRVRIQRSPFQVSFLDLKGNLINQDAAGEAMAWSDRGVRARKVMPADEQKNLGPVFVLIHLMTGTAPQLHGGMDDGSSGLVSVAPDAAGEVNSCTPLHLPDCGMLDLLLREAHSHEHE